MNASTSSSGGCGSGSCQCATAAAQSAAPVASINGISLHAPGEQPDLLTLQELAYTELLKSLGSALLFIEMQQAGGGNGGSIHLQNSTKTCGTSSAVPIR